MSRAADPRLLALLVHRGLLSREVVEAALASGDPRGFLVGGGHATAAQWREWVATVAAIRPMLSRYAVGDLLGRGGTARVWAARDRTDGREIALKVLERDLAAERGAMAAFVSESKLLIELDCPHIVKGLRVAREGPVVFCAMERISGHCLQDELGGGRRLDEERALRAVRDIAVALEYLHGKGYVHCDIKPGNAMVAADGRAVLIDLGFAVATGPAASQAGDETTSGTVHYISPEQARGRSGLDVRADIYSLGATLYHLVTGSLPFAGESHEEVMAKQVLEALSGEAIRALGLAPQTHYFIEKMMAKEKGIRFQTPRQLIDEIGAHLDAAARERAAEQEALRRQQSRRRLRRFL